jgi:hypothetical protein
LRISKDAQKCVVFFGVAPPAGQISYAGTGFLIVHREGFELFTYLVTARHVAERLEEAGDFVVRTNLKDGAASSIPMHGIKWRYHSDPTVDLAAIEFTIDCIEYDVIYYDLVMMVTRSIGPNAVICGDQISIVGLFHLHPGAYRHTPIVHTGNIAAVADPQERIPVRDTKTREVINVEAYLVEAQTLEGLSGAPVFIREIINLAIVEPIDGVTPLALGGVKLVGLYQASWDGRAGDILSNDRKIDGRRVPVGMGIVVPGEKILELIIDDPVLKKDRDDRRTRRHPITASFPVPWNVKPKN